MSCFGQKGLEEESGGSTASTFWIIFTFFIQKTFGNIYGGLLPWTLLRTTKLLRDRRIEGRQYLAHCNNKT